MRANPYIYDTFKLHAADDSSTLTSCRLEYGDGVFYPERDFDTQSKTRIFNALMGYSWKKNDYNTGTQLNISNFSTIYPLIFFDLSYQADGASRDPKQLILKYMINTNDKDQFSVHAIVLYEKDVVVDKVGDQLVIV